MGHALYSDRRERFHRAHGTRTAYFCAPMSAADLTTKVVASINMVDAEVGEGVVVLHLGNGQYFGLENTAARIWSLLKEPVEIAEIVEALVQEYEVDRAVCEREVQDLVSGLIDEGLVEVRS